MIKYLCICKEIQSDYANGIERFINSILEKYDIVKVLQTPFTTKEREVIYVTVIYKKNVVELEADRELLKGIVRMKTGYSINITQQEFNVGFNRASDMISLLEDLKIISSKNKNNKRKLLMPIEEAYEVIDDFIDNYQEEEDIF